MTDLLIAGRYTRVEVQQALRAATGLSEIVVLLNIVDCLELSENTPWVTMYPDYNGKFPTYISTDGMDFPKTALSALATKLNCDIVFELYPDPNPNVWSIIKASGDISTIELSDEEMEPSDTGI